MISVNFNQNLLMTCLKFILMTCSGRNMSAIKDEEELYRNMKNLSIIYHVYCIWTSANI